MAPFANDIADAVTAGVSALGAAMESAAPDASVMPPVNVAEPSTLSVAPSATVTGRATETPLVTVTVPPLTLSAEADVWLRVSVSVPSPVFVIAPGPCGSATSEPLNPLESRTSPPASIVTGLIAVPPSPIVSNWDFVSIQ